MQLNSFMFPQKNESMLNFRVEQRKTKNTLVSNKQSPYIMRVLF